jgi:hypothetical protein
MDVINAIFGQILLVLILLVFFGMIAGVKSDRIVTTYLNLVVQVFVAIAEILIKIAVPLLKQTGQKVVYATNHYIAEQEKQKQQQAVSTDMPTAFAGPAKPMPNTSAPPPVKPAPAKSGNLYDQHPEPEIMH